MSLRGVYRILRLPLAVTAVADVIAGYAVTRISLLYEFDWSVAGWLAGTSAGLYLFGMVENDLVDIRRDRLLKQPRPLVTGEIGVAAAVVLLILTAGLSAVCASRLTGGAVTMSIAAFAAINLYNLGAKHGPVYVAMSTMGLCRLLNFGIGVVAGLGFPRQLGVELFLPSGPLWVRQGLALFFTTWIVTGYSISARAGLKATSLPWKVVFFAAAIGGFAMIALSTMPSIAGEHSASGRLNAPVARVLAALLLAGLWPGGLWSAAGNQRHPEEYGPFVERTLYWMVAMDAAFVLDALLLAR